MEDDREYVRPNDPETSHEAAARLDVRRDSFLALGYFREICNGDGIIAAEFDQYLEKTFLGNGMTPEQAYRRAESLRRRLSDLERKFGMLEVRQDSDGKRLKRDKQQIYFLKKK